VYFFLSPHLPTFANAYRARAIHYLSWLLSTSTSNMGLKSFLPLCMHEPVIPTFYSNKILSI
jgi:hypothetical protein